MATDGGGYTVAPVRDGLTTRKVSDADSCAAVGMQLVVPRTRAHLVSLLRRLRLFFLRLFFFLLLLMLLPLPPLLLWQWARRRRRRPLPSRAAA